MPITTSAMHASKDRRRGWINNSSEGSDAHAGFRVRDNVAVWNRGLGPSQNSIPSRKSSLASEPASPTTPTTPAFSQVPTSWSPSNRSAEAGPSRLPSARRQTGESASPTSSTFSETRHARTPSGRVIGPSAFSDHQRIMAAARAARGSAADSSKRYRQQTSRHSASSHSAQSSEAQSSVASFDGADSAAFDASTPATSQATSTASSAHGLEVDKDANGAAIAAALAPSSSPVSSPAHRKNNGSLLASVKPMPPVVERSTTPDPEAALSSPSEGKAKPKPIAKNGLAKRRDLRIELPPSRGYKSAYPAILVDSSHLNDDFMTPSYENSDEDDSSWPSTPSTTPLEHYLAKPDVQKALGESPKGPMSDGRALRAAYLTVSSQAGPAQTSRPGSDASSAEVDRPARAPGPTSQPLTSTASATASSTCDTQTTPCSLQQELERGRPTLSFDLPRQMPTKPSQESPKKPPVSFLTRAANKLSSPKAAARISHHRRTSASAIQVSTGSSSPGLIGAAEGAEGRSQSLDQARPAEKRRSFELRPILLNSTANLSRTSANLPSTANFVLSGTNVGGLQYTKRSSNQSQMSSTTSLATPGRVSDVSNDPQVASPRASTTITVPSPTLSSENKHLQPMPGREDPKPSGPVDAAEDPYTPLPPSASRRAALSSSVSVKRMATEQQAKSQRIMLQEHIEKQKGKITQDSDSIKDWIQISSKDLPPPGAHPYGNGGKGAFSSEQLGKRLSSGGGRGWKFGRFSASNIALPQSQPAQTAMALGGRKMSILRRPKTSAGTPPSFKSTVKEAGNTVTSVGDAQAPTAAKVPTQPSKSAEAPQIPPRTPVFTPNMGWTSANRNAALQDLCQRKSVSALAAAALGISSLGRESAPYQMPDAPGKDSRIMSKQRVGQIAASPEKVKPQRPRATKGGPDGQRAHEARASTAEGVVRSPGESTTNGRVRLLEQARYATKLDPASPTYGTLLSAGQGDFQPAYEVKDQSQTVKSVHPEVGSWSIDDLDDDADFFDSDTGSEGSSSCRDDDDHDEEDGEEQEVPRQMAGFHSPGQRREEAVQPAMLNVFFSSIRGAPEQLSQDESANSSAPGQFAVKSDASAVGRCDRRLPNLTRKSSLRSGAITNRGKEIRLSVQVPAPAGRRGSQAQGEEATVAVTWKAVRVSQLASSTCEDLGYLASRRASAQKTRAMTLEAEVQRGQFASFVGLSSPKRKGRSDSFDAGRSGRSDGARRSDADDDLFISKTGTETAFVVVRPDLPRNNREEFLEIVARAHEHHPTGQGASSTETYRDELPIRYSVDEENQANRDKLPGTPMFDLDRAFPSPLTGRLGRRSSHDSSRDGDLGWGTGPTVQLHVRRRGLNGFRASFDASDGRRWFWRTNAPMLSGGSAPTSASGSATGINGGCGLSGSELQLFAMDGAEAVQLATYSADSMPRNALGLFKPRSKAQQAAVPEEATASAPERVSPPVSPLTRTVQLGPLVGIRGAKPIRNAAPPTAASGPGLRRGQIMQNRRAAVSTDSLIHPASNQQAAVLANAAAAAVAVRRSMDTPRSAPMSTPMSEPQSILPSSGSANMGPQKRMGDVKFLSDCYDHDLATVSLLALLGMVKV